jgi:hypothetical protein
MTSLHEVIIEELASGATKLDLAKHITQALGGDKRLEFLINKAIETYFEPTKKYIRAQFISILKSKGGSKNFIKDHAFKLGGRIDAMYNICATKSRGGTKDFDFYGANRKTYKKFLFETSDGTSTSIYIDILKAEG